MAEPAELLIIKDQYVCTCHCLHRGLAAEDADNKSEALVLYRKAHQHLTQGLEVPTQGERHHGEAWDKARHLQQKMEDMLETVNDHLSELEKSPENANYVLLLDDSSAIYPNLATKSQPSKSTLHHLYPTIPATSPAPYTAPINPASPAVPNTYTLPAGDRETVTMDNPAELPPAYTPKPTDGHCRLPFDPVGASFWPGRPGQAVANEKELLYIPSGVQLFFVEPSGQVSSLSYPSYLRIITVDSLHSNSRAGKPSATLRVGSWMYPLMADTPVLLANSGIFMFPDCLSETPGSYVGLVFSSELPAADCEMFQDLLTQLTDFRIQDPEGTGVEVMNLTTKVPLGHVNEYTAPAAEREIPAAKKEIPAAKKEIPAAKKEIPAAKKEIPAAEKEVAPLPGWSEKMAQGILSGATRLSQSFAKGAEATGRAIHKGGAKIRDRITPEETPSEVNPRVTKGLNATKQATGGAVRVTQLLVSGLSTIAGHVADKVGPQIKKYGPKLVPEALKKNQDGQPSNFDGAKLVAVSGVQGFSTVWSSLESGAKLVCKSVSAETVTTVKYKYGEDTGEATNTALVSVGNIGLAAHNLDNLGIKAFLKTTSKKTATTMSATPDGELAETEEKKVRREEQQSQTEGRTVQKKKEEEKKE